MSESQTIKERLILYIKHLGIGQKKFEIKCGLSNGYINNIRKTIMPDKLQKISLHNPDLNTGWLMTGEGEMLKSNVSIENGDDSTQVIDDGNNINTPSTLDKALDALAKSQEQIDRLIVVIEKLTDK